MIIEAARGASAAASADPGDRAFASGAAVAYHDAITLVQQQQLVAFGLQERFAAIVAFDATGELLVGGSRRDRRGPP